MSSLYFLAFLFSPFGLRIFFLRSSSLWQMIMFSSVDSFLPFERVIFGQVDGRPLINHPTFRPSLREDVPEMCCCIFCYCFSETFQITFWKDFSHFIGGDNNLHVLASANLLLLLLPLADIACEIGSLVGSELRFFFLPPRKRTSISVPDRPRGMGAGNLFNWAHRPYCCFLK